MHYYVYTIIGGLFLCTFLWTLEIFLGNGVSNIYRQKSYNTKLVVVCPLIQVSPLDHINSLTSYKPINRIYVCRICFDMIKMFHRENMKFSSKIHTVFLQKNHKKNLNFIKKTAVTTYNYL